MEDDAGHKCVPVWPHKRYAESLIRDDWSAAMASAIDLEAWMTHWLPDMARNGLQIAVFPVQGQTQSCVIISPETLRRELEVELEQYEDNDEEH